MDASSGRALGVDPQPPEPRDINVLFNHPSLQRFYHSGQS